MVKLANTHDSGSCVARLAGSSPVTRTKNTVDMLILTVFFYCKILYLICQSDIIIMYIFASKKDG